MAAHAIACARNQAMLATATSRSLLLASFDATAPRLAPRSGLLGAVLLPLGARPNVFVANDDTATRVTIHKTAGLDIEVVISTKAARWSASVRDVATGRVLVQDLASYDGATPHERRAAMLGDLHAFFARVVDAPVRLSPIDGTRLECAARGDWRQALPLPR